MISSFMRWMASITRWSPRTYAEVLTEVEKCAFCEGYLIVKDKAGCHLSAEQDI